MPYWILENGEGRGPYRAAEILEKAKPSTLVSVGEEWVRFDEHPDFLRIDERGSTVRDPQTQAEDNESSWLEKNPTILKWALKGTYAAAEIGFAAFRQARGGNHSSFGMSHRIQEFSKAVDKSFK